jgi:hypothetical protein
LARGVFRTVRAASGFDGSIATMRGSELKPEVTRTPDRHREAEGTMNT